MLRNNIDALCIRDKYVRNGKLNILFLKPNIERFIRRWGYYDLETSCKFFEFVIELLKEEAKRISSESKVSATKKEEVVPTKTVEAAEKVVTEVPSGITQVGTEKVKDKPTMPKASKKFVLPSAK